ncbi:MAG: HD domain-containing protein [Lachnospiraceae bacterium]|nr:HD domain-containing protein [Lachnospiraceae bacterium]
MELHEIKEKLKESLSKSRYEHTLGVANTATCLAMRYEYDLEKAYLAGLLHDCAKATPDKDKLRECRENNIPITRQEELLPHLLHAKLGEFKAKNEYGIDDPEILNAIKFHTTGRVNMSLLEKIIFVADYIEPGRDKAANLTFLRKIAFVNLDETIYHICKDTIYYLNSLNSIIDVKTLETYEYYKNK